MTRIVSVCLLAAAMVAAQGPEFVEIPAGSFIFGCDPPESCPERQPPRPVTFDRPFLIHKTEVTVGGFRRFVEATGYRTQAEENGDPWTWSSPRAFRLRETQPVVSVSLRDAEAYCAWIDARLPTEEEWTYAFRAAETVTGHLWWNTDGRYVWYRENSSSSPQPVGRKLPNAWGLHDMEGNAWEWTRTQPDNQYPGAIRGGSWVTCRVIEGGPLPPGSESEPFRPFSRCLSDGNHIRDDVGFRCVVSD